MVVLDGVGCVGDVVYCYFVVFELVGVFVGDLGVGFGVYYD